MRALAERLDDPSLRMADEVNQLGSCALIASCLSRATWKRQLRRTDRSTPGGNSQRVGWAFGFGDWRFYSALSLTAFLFTFLRSYRRKTAHFGPVERFRGMRPAGPGVGGITSSRGLIFPFFSLDRCPSRVPQARSGRASVFWSVHGQPQSYEPLPSAQGSRS